MLVPSCDSTRADSPLGPAAAEEPRLAEGEDIRLGSGLEKGDLKEALVDASALAYQLIEAPISGCALAAMLDVDSASASGRRSVEADTEPNRVAAFHRPHDQVQIARAKA